MVEERKVLKPIIIIGAPRSGTSLLRNLIDENLAGCLSFGEINEKWKLDGRYSIFDEVLGSQLAGTDKGSIREWFDQEGENAGATFILEKTTGNSLRLPLVHGVFPDALILNITRDGRDASVSVRRQMEGDRRKVTAAGGEGMAFGTRVRDIRNVLRNKRKAGVGPGTMWRERRRYFEGFLGTLGVRRAFFGPRYHGCEEDFRAFERIEVAGRLWSRCVGSTRNYLAANPELEVVELRFEELLANPIDVVQRILQRLGVFREVQMSREIRPLRTWRDSLSERDKRLLANIIEADLRILGYPPTFERTSNNNRDRV